VVGNYITIAHPGQSGKGVLIGTEGGAEPGCLGQAAGDQHGPGVVAEAHADGDTNSDRDDVLDRAAELAAGHVRMV